MFWGTGVLVDSNDPMHKNKVSVYKILLSSILFPVEVRRFPTIPRFYTIVTRDAV